MNRIYKNLSETYQLIIGKIGGFLKEKYRGNTASACEIGDDRDIKVTFVPLRPEVAEAYRKLGKKLHEQQQTSLESKMR